MVYKSDKFRLSSNKHTHDLIKHSAWIKFATEKSNMAIVLPRNFSLVLAEEDGSCFQRITPSSTANNEGFFRSCNGFSTLRKAADVPKVWHGTMLPSE